MCGIRGRRGGVASGAEMEALEARVVLSSAHSLAAVGLAMGTEGVFAPYHGEISWDSARRVTSELFGPSGGVPGPTLDGLETFLDGPRGQLRSRFAPAGYDAVFGSRMITAEGFPAGWIGGAMDDGSQAHVAALIDRATDLATGDLAGNWSMQFTRVTSTGVFTYNSIVSFNASGGFISVGFGAINDPPFIGEGFVFTDVAADGRIEFAGLGNDPGVMYVNADKSVLLAADVDDTDGDTWMGYAIRQDVDPAPEDIAGSYRLGLLAEGDKTSTLFGGPADAWLLEIEEDGSFEVFDLSESDAGDPGDPISSGTWVNEGGQITFTDTATGLETGAKFSDNARTLQITQFRLSADSFFERPMAIGTRVDADSTGSFGSTVWSGVLDGDGLPLVFDLRLEGDQWKVVDLDRYALGDAIGDSPADIEVFQASDATLLAAVTTADGLFGFGRAADGFWRSVNLTEAISGAESIVSSITVFNDLSGRSHVAGVTGSGEVVTYVFDPDEGDDGEWTYVNISETHLDPAGRPTPQFVGPIISYVTSWNGLNIAGLDAAGDIQAVWSGNGGTSWNASNLSTITGAPAMASGLTAYLTSWGGINIVGLDTSGTVLATWWVPSFGGAWRTADLTAASGGPQLVGTSLTSFVAPWGGLNVAGLSADGDVIAFWWSPATERDGRGWEVANLTAAIPDNEPTPTLGLHSQTNTSYGGEMNVLGTDADSGDLLRLFFRVDAGSWQVENVSGEADYV